MLLAQVGQNKTLFAMMSLIVLNYNSPLRSDSDGKGYRDFKMLLFAARRSGLLVVNAVVNFGFLQPVDDPL